MPPSLVRSERLDSTDSSDGGGVAVHAYVLTLDTMERGRAKRALALRAQLPLNRQVHDRDAHAAVGEVEGR